MCVFAYAISLIVYQLGSLFLTSVFGVGTVAALLLLAVLIFLVVRPNPYHSDYEKDASVSVRLNRNTSV